MHTRKLLGSKNPAIQNLLGRKAASIKKTLIMQRAPNLLLDDRLRSSQAWKHWTRIPKFTNTPTAEKRQGEIPIIRTKQILVLRNQSSCSKGYLSYRSSKMPKQYSATIPQQPLEGLQYKKQDHCAFSVNGMLETRYRTFSADSCFFKPLKFPLKQRKKQQNRKTKEPHSLILRYTRTTRVE